MNPNKPLAAIAVACALALNAGAARAQTPPVSPLAWLVGGTWVAQPSGLGNVARIETQYHWAATGNFIQFTTQFLNKDGKPSGNYAGNFYFDPAANHLAMWYMDRDNAITQGKMEIAGDTWSMFFSGDAGSEGQADFRVVVTKNSNDAYHWALSERTGGSAGAWKPLFGLDYARHSS